MITATGWTWQHIDHHVTLPQVITLFAFWKHTPPAAMQLRRIAIALGLGGGATKVEPAATPQEAFQQAAAAGLGVIQGRPDDPMLNFLDL